MAPPRINPLTRYIVLENGCWLWSGSLNKEGYGRQSGKSSHRIFYIAHKGPINCNLEVDHLCRNRACVNPDHLELVSHAENVRRGVVGVVNSARLKSKTHCKNGHEYTEENIYRWARLPHNRSCRTCHRIYEREKYKKRSCIKI